MFSGGYNEDDIYHYQQMMAQRGGPRRRFDEYYRCYPIAMMPGPERDSANHGGKVFLPASALDKLTKLHITYPMLFELINGKAGKTTHAGVLEFTAEEGKVYLPYWTMQTLGLEPGDLVQIKSTDLPLGRFIKLQPQSTAFLDISDPKAVLEQAFRNFSCLSTGDVFTFHYNDTVYHVAVLEVKPTGDDKNAISVVETDLEVDFAPPIGYKEPERSGTSTPRAGLGSGALAAAGGTLHAQGTMAQAINYASIAPSSALPAAGAKAVSSNFLTQGHKLAGKKGSKAPTPKPSTPVPGASGNAPAIGATVRRVGSGPQPLRLPPGKLFFGYEIKAVRKKGEGPEETRDGAFFKSEGQSLRKKKGDK